MVNSHSKYQLIKHLIDKVAQFEESVPAEEMTMAAFVSYLNNIDQDGALPMRKLGGELEDNMQRAGNEQDMQIAILVTFMNRYAKLYAKKVLQNSPLSTADEFSYLIVLLTHSSLSKTELIHKNVHEKTTGMEILKRLLKQGYIRQFDDAEDKRTQRVAITEAGKGVLFSVLGQMGDVTKIVTGNLTPLEKNSLAYLLRKLDHFHFDIFMNERQTPLEEIIRKKMNG